MPVVTTAASSSHVYDLMFWKTSPLDSADLSDSSSVKTQRLLGGHDMDVPLRAEYYPSSSLHVCQLRVSIVMSSAAAAAAAAKKESFSGENRVMFSSMSILTSH